MAKARAWVALSVLVVGALACGSTNKSSRGTDDENNGVAGTGAGGGYADGGSGVGTGGFCTSGGCGVGGSYYGTAGTAEIAGYPGFAGVGGVYYGSAGYGGGFGFAGVGGVYYGSAGYGGGFAGVGGVYYSDGAGNLPQTCTSPRVDPNTGLTICAEGYAHRPKAVECEIPTTGDGGAAGLDPHDMPRADGTVLCDEQPAKCAKYQYGYCDEGRTGACQSGCSVDTDCGPGYLCHCGAAASAHGGVCEPTQCRTDANCANGALCATFDGLCGKNGFACLSYGDTCTSSDQCGGQICTWDPGFLSRHCAFANCPR